MTTRTEIHWAGSIRTAVGDGSPELLLGQPDARAYVVADGWSVTLRDFRPVSYENLAELLGTAVSGDVVTQELLAEADVIAFEHNGNEPGPSGGWESCDWAFSDGPRTLVIHWDERTVDGVPGHQPVPRDPHVVANGTITGASFGSFFGLSDSAIMAQNPAGGTPAGARVSFLLFRLRPEVDVRSPDLEITLSGVPPSGAAATPDADAVGLLVHVITPAATLAGASTPVQPPPALTTIVDRLSFDQSRGWPPQLSGPAVAVDAAPSGLPMTFADWQRYLAIAVAHPEVRELLDDTFIWLGCHLLGVRSEGSPVRVLVALRNSATGQLIDVTISGEAVTGVEIKRPWGHPESPTEMETAIDLVRAHPDHGRHVAGLEAHAILRVPDDASHPSTGHRCMHVMFTKPDDPFVERAVCYAAMVDLETRTVIAARRSPCNGSPVASRRVPGDHDPGRGRVE